MFLSRSDMQIICKGKDEMINFYIYLPEIKKDNKSMFTPFGI